MQAFKVAAAIVVAATLVGCKDPEPSLGASDATLPPAKPTNELSAASAKISPSVGPGASTDPVPALTASTDPVPAPAADPHEHEYAPLLVIPSQKLAEPDDSARNFTVRQQHQVYLGRASISGDWAAQDPRNPLADAHISFTVTKGYLAGPEGVYHAATHPGPHHWHSVYRK
jgi:hypothetical protein